MNKLFLRLATLWLSVASLNPAWANVDSDVSHWVDQEKLFASTFYKDIHRHPELSFHEVRTAGKVRNFLKTHGFKIVENLGGHSVAGVLKNGSGPTLMLRMELDALPIQESTGADFASVTPGTMHACGHDAHEAIVLSTAKILASHRPLWHGTLVVFAQSAEEVLEGARTLLHSEGKNALPKIDVVLGVHTRYQDPSGDISFRMGPITSFADNVKINFRGADGYVMDDGPNALNAATNFVQNLVSLERKNSPHGERPGSRVRVTAIESGDAYNVQSSHAIVLASLRATTETEEKARLAELKEMVSSAARDTGLTEKPEVQIEGQARAVVNSERITKIALPIFQGTVGAGHVRSLWQLFGAEDFSEFAKLGTPELFYYYIGSSSPAWTKPWAQNHSSAFRVDFETTYHTGTLSLSLLALALLKRPQ